MVLTLTDILVCNDNANLIKIRAKWSHTLEIYLEQSLVCVVEGVQSLWFFLDRKKVSKERN